VIPAAAPETIPLLYTVFALAVLLNFVMLGLVSTGHITLRLNRMGLPCHLRRAGNSLSECIRCEAFHYGAVFWPFFGTAILVLSGTYLGAPLLIGASVLIILLGAIQGSASRVGILKSRVLTQVMGFFMPLSAVLLAFGLVRLFDLTIPFLPV
jgi:hypothetical protein